MTRGIKIPWPRVGNAAVASALAGIGACLLRLHAGDWWLAPPLPWQWRWAGISVMAYAALCGVLALRTQRRSARHDSQASILIVWASQTGFARELAERSAAVLDAAGQPARLLALEHVDATTLAATTRVLFVVSTSGIGDAPDNAQRFVRETLIQAPALSTLEYGLLALGDRNYGHFCEFGRRLDAWLAQHGARSLFDRIEVDNADPDALRHWQHLLAHLSGAASSSTDWIQPHYRPWRLRERDLLNPGSVGAPVYRIRLLPASEALPQWQPGDIAEIAPRNPPAAVRRWLDIHGLEGSQPINGKPLRDWLAESRLPASIPAASTLSAFVAALKALPHREYSIASLPGEGHLELLIRRHFGADGTPGLGSSWLCEHAALDGEIALRIRSNPGLHPPPPQLPMVLIGNGTGIAGLRAQLKARIQAGARRNWLLFGERNAAHDCLYGAELDAWQHAGDIERLDRVFSRDTAQPPHYVQHVLALAAATLRDWVDQGASIYVCGSLRGMAPDVDRAIEDALGATLKQALLAQGRYHRDVY